MPSQYNSQTSQKLQIHCRSAILDARFQQPEVSQGGAALLRILTQCVENGSQVKMKYKDFTRTLVGLLSDFGSIEL